MTHDKIYRLATLFEMKLGQAHTPPNKPFKFVLDKTIHQQWINDIKQVSLAAINLLQFWLNFLTASNVESADNSDYEARLNICRQLQSITMATPIPAVAKAVAFIIDKNLYMNAIMVDCTNAEWYHSYSGMWLNKKAAIAFKKCIELYRAFIIKADQEHKSFEKVAAEWEKQHQPTPPANEPPQETQEDDPGY